MLVVINDNVIGRVEVNEKGYPVIPEDYLNNSMSNLSNVWPYVFLPSISPNDIVECELGYWDNDNLSKRVCPIVYDSVSILSISIKFEKNQLHDRVSWYAKDMFQLFYHYVILLELRNDSHCKTYRFESDDYIEINYNRRECPKMRTMKRLFNKVIPMLNEFISKGFPIDQLNRCYVQSCFPQKADNYIERCYIHDYNQLKKIIYSSRINTTQGGYFLEIGRGVMPFVNHHVGEIISSILGVSFIRDNKEEFIFGNVSNLLEIKYLDESLLLPYCIAKLFFNAELIYSSEVANKEIMLAVSEVINESISKSKDNRFFKPSLDVVKMVDFIFNIDAEHKRDGQYRAGRDDIEWEYKQFSFPLKHSYTPSKELIGLINSVLKIKLEQKDGCYSYSETIDEGYVAWLARKEDLGSEELKRSSMNKIFNRIYSIFLSDQSLFKKLVKE